MFSFRLGANFTHNSGNHYLHQYKSSSILVYFHHNGTHKQHCTWFHFFSCMVCSLLQFYKFVFEICSLMLLHEKQGSTIYCL